MIKRATANRELAERLSSYVYIPPTANMTLTTSLLESRENFWAQQGLLLWRKLVVWDLKYVFLSPPSYLSLDRQSNWRYRWNDEHYPLYLKPINWPEIELEELFF